MPKTSNQRAKVLVLLNIFQRETDEGHPLSVPALVERMEAAGMKCERKSLYDCIRELQALGYDIVYQPNYGYYLGEREFQLAELKLLADAVQASKFITVQKSQELIKKLSRQASEYQASALQRQVYVAGKARTVNERVYYTIDSIYEAIARNRQISFRYFDYDRNRNKVFRRNGAVYTASPYAMLRDNDNYYLVAYDAQSAQLRHYRVDKMEQLTLLDAPRSGQEVFAAEDTSRYADRHFGMFSGDTEEVVLLCKPWMAHVLIDRFGDDVVMLPGKDETFRAVVRVVVSPQFFGWLFGLEGGAVVLEPEHVRFQMQQALKEMLKTYEQ